MAVLENVLQVLSIKKKVQGNFSARLAIAARAVLDTQNKVVVEPDYPVGSIAGATVTTAPALKLTDIANGKRYAVVMNNGALDIIEIAAND